MPTLLLGTDIFFNRATVLPPKPRVFRESGETGSHRPGQTPSPAENLKSRVSFRHVSSVCFTEAVFLSYRNVTSASRVRTRRDSRMADIEDNAASARAKRPVGIASAAGRRERRAPASKVRAASVNKKPPVFFPHFLARFRLRASETTRSRRVRR